LLRAGSGPDGEPASSQISFCFADGERSVVEDGCAESAVGASYGQTFVDVLERSHATRGDYGNRNSVDYRSRELQVVARARAIAIHAREQDFSCAEVDDAFGPRDRVESRVGASAAGEDVPSKGIVCARTFCIDSDDDRLSAPTCGGAFDESRITHCGSVDGDLVGAGVEKRFDVPFAFHSASNGEGRENAVCGRSNDIEQRSAAFMGCGDVEERDLVGACGVVALSNFDWVAGIAQRDELNAFDDAPVFDIEAGNDALCEHSARIAPMSMPGQVMRKRLRTRLLARRTRQLKPFGETLPNRIQGASMRGVHCPECGSKANPGAATCAACGQPLPEEVLKPLSVISGRTIVGGASARSVPAPLADDMPTLVKEPKKGARVEAPRPKAGPGMQGAADEAPRPRMPSQLQNTILGGVVPAELQALPGPAPNPPKTSAQGTILGLADPAAPGAGARPKDGKAPREMPHELGATLVPQPARPVKKPNRELAERLDPQAMLINRDKLARRRVVLPPVRSREELAKLESQKRLKKAAPYIVGGLVLLIGAVVIVTSLNSSSPISAKARIAADGHETIEVACATCPDGTKVVLGDTTATIAANVAQIPLVAPLSLGENRLKIALDRPGKGRDETVGVAVQVGYRLRPDLSMLNADKPTVHIAVEALDGTEITLDGQPVKLDGGPKAHPIDVSAACTGSSDEPATLRRSVAYVAKSKDGTRTEGTVEVAVGIVPLRIDAPGPRVVTESDTFVLSGHTIKGAEVLVAGRPIQVSSEGAFAQRMSVSSIGATNIEVRAKIPGMAPRIVPIAVQRVEKLEEAAKDFQKEKPVGYTTVALASTSDVGRPVVISGQVAEVRVQNHQTIFLLNVPENEGCSRSNEACRVRLIQGSASNAKVGETLTAYGQIARPSSGAGGAIVPEIQVAFTLPGSSRAPTWYENR